MESNIRIRVDCMKLLDELRLKLVQQERKGQGTGREIYILRMNSVIMCIYFLILCSTVIFSRDGFVTAFSIPFFLGYCLIFYLTYRHNIIWAKWATQIGGLMFVWIFIILFGWECGAQHFLFVHILLVMFTISPKSYQFGIWYSGALCVMRAVMYFYNSVKDPIYMLTDRVRFSFQLINSVGIFAAIIGCVLIVIHAVAVVEERNYISENKLEELKRVDPLTGLLNRKIMMEELESQENLAKGTGTKFSIAVGNIDSFKKINDRYCHDCGDLLIKQLSHIFSEFMEEKGVVARWSGGEFLFLFCGASGEDAYFYLTKLQQQTRDTIFEWKDDRIRITMTYGVMEESSNRSLDSCITEAERKLSMGKESGRNTIIF